MEKLDKTIQGIGNRIEVLSMGMFDKHGHGTGVATAACGQQNDKASCGVNPKAQVFPIKISDGKAGGPAPSDDLAMTAAMMVMYQKGTRIINISYGPLMEQSEHRVLHAMFRDWFERKDGLVFISAGNAGEKLGSRDEAYINVVSAMGKVDNEMVLANNGMWSSASGPCVDFTAPGQGIQCASPSGRSISMDGTSLSTPLCSAVASLIWTVNPRLKNTQVIEIMRLACVNTTVGRNNKFGYGMPDAARAVKIAEASR